MAVQPTIARRGTYTVYTWTLTSADQDALPTPPIGGRNEKSVDVRGASTAAGFNGATVEVHGSLDESEAGTYKLLNTLPDTLTLSFTAASTQIYPILPHVLRVKPVVAAGTVGATGVEVVILVTSAQSLAQ
jgi:hypothetical protein